MIRAVLVLLAVAGPGCEDPCGGGDTACLDDGTLMVCQSIRDGFAVSHEWQAQSCPDLNPICVDQDTDPNVTPQRTGACVSSATPADECLASPDGFCSGGIRYGCAASGHAIALERCASGCDAAGEACDP